MDHISNLCKVLAICFLGLIPLSSSAQQAQQRFVGAMCGDLVSLVQWLNDEQYTMIMMGQTFTEGVADSLWVKVPDEFVYIRAVKRTGEGCMIASGKVAYSYFLDQERI